MSAASVARQGRRFAESLMDSEIQFFTSGEDVTDPSTGEVTRGQTVIWSGPCRIRPAGRGETQAGSVDVGGAELFTFDYLVSIPWSVTEVLEHMRGTVTDCPDLALAGVTMEVQKVSRGSTLTARRLACALVV